MKKKYILQWVLSFFDNYKTSGSFKFMITCHVLVDIKASDSYYTLLNCTCYVKVVGEVTRNKLTFPTVFINLVSLSVLIHNPISSI